MKKGRDKRESARWSDKKGATKRVPRTLPSSSTLRGVDAALGWARCPVKRLVVLAACGTPPRSATRAGSSRAGGRSLAAWLHLLHGRPSTRSTLHRQQGQLLLLVCTAHTGTGTTLANSLHS